MNHSLHVETEEIILKMLNKEEITIFHQEIPEHHILQAWDIVTVINFVTVINYIMFNNGIIFIAELLAIFLQFYIILYSDDIVKIFCLP